MKKIKVCVLGMLFAMAVFALTACGNRGNAADNTTSAAQNQTTQPTTQSVTKDSDGMGMNGTNESSTGVIGGIVDDVERGVNDVMDGTEQTTVHTADETAK